MKYLLVSIFSIFIIIQSTQAQELRCNVSVSHQKIQGANQTLFQTMRSDIYEFMNNRKWTDHVYSYDERIRCNISIILDEQLSADEFKGSIRVSVSSPGF